MQPKKNIRSMLSGEIQAEIKRLNARNDRDRARMNGRTQKIHCFEEELAKRRDEKVNVHVFSSTECRNIEIAMHRCIWAVRRPRGGVSALNRLQSKAEEMTVGSLGLFYDSEHHNLVMAFKVRSRPNFRRIVSDIWPGGEYLFPFEIEPLGSIDYYVNRIYLPMLLERSIREREVGSRNWHHVLRISPRCAFLASTCYREERDDILRRLCPNGFEL